MSFKDNDYLVIENFLEEDFIDFIQDYYSLKINSGKFDIDEKNFNYGYNFYSDHVMETILQNSCESLSKIIDINLLPTYSSTKFMMNGDYFESIKNNSCEITGIINLGTCNDSQVEPIFISNHKNKKNSIQIILNKGDILLINNNNNLYCWRESIKSKWILEGFLNFVNSKGPYKENIYNKRPYLGFKQLPEKYTE